MSVEKTSNGRWLVRWREDGRQRGRRFIVKRDADAFDREVQRRRQLGPRRRIRVVIAHTRRHAFSARHELLAGQPWSTVIRRYFDGPGKRVGHDMLVLSTNAIPAVRRAVFAGPLHWIIGPTRLG